MRRAIKKSSRPMPSSRHVGHRVGVRVCVVYEAAYHVARVLFSRQEAGAVADDLPASFRALARSFARERASCRGLEIRAMRTG